MNLPVKVYKVQDGDWFAARTPLQALQKQVSESGEQMYLVNNVRELTDEELERHCVLDENFGDEEPVTFRVALDRLVKAGTKFPCMLASTE